MALKALKIDRWVPANAQTVRKDAKKARARLVRRAGKKINVEDNFNPKQYKGWVA